LFCYEDCWIFVGWLHFCPKQIFKWDVGHDVSTSWHGSVCPVLCLVFTHAFIYLRNPRLISCWSNCVFLVHNQNICYFLKECYLIRKLWICTEMFLMMCLHIRTFLIWFWLMWNGSPFVCELFWSLTKLYDPYCFSI